MPSKYERKVRISEYGTDAFIANLHSTVAVIVTHPWGPLGGNMYNNVVNAVVLYFQRIQITTVRFNFAGTQIGRGYYQVEQINTIAKKLISGELLLDEDNNHALNEDSSSSNQQQQQQQNKQTSSKNNTLPKYILLIGYSYGSLIAGSASATIPQCIGTIYIAPPFGVQHWLLLFHSNYHLKKAAERNESYFKRLFILGTKDNFTTESTFTSTIEQYFSQTNQQQQQNHHPDINNADPNSSSFNSSSAALLKDADHFFQRREKDVMDIIGQWIMTTAYPNQCPNGDLYALKTMEIPELVLSSSMQQQKQTQEDNAAMKKTATSSSGMCFGQI